MIDSLVVIGGGGHGLVVAEAAALAGMSLSGFVDDDRGAVLSRGQPKCAWLGALAGFELPAGSGCILALGDLEKRAALIPRLKRDSLRTVVHTRAMVSPSAVIGRGVFIGPGVIVHARAEVADHAILNSGCIVEHECRVGVNAHIAPGAVLGGRVTIGESTLIGLGSRILPNLSVGARCVVGAGAVVNRVVPDEARVVGVPARGMR